MDFSTLLATWEDEEPSGRYKVPMKSLTRAEGDATFYRIRGCCLRTTTAGVHVSTGVRHPW